MFTDKTENVVDVTHGDGDPLAFHMTMQSIHHAVGYSCMAVRTAIMFSIDCGPTHLSLNGQTGDAAISMRDGGNTITVQ